MVISVSALLAGACVGVGVTMVVAGWCRPAPDLRTALAQLDTRFDTRPAAPVPILPALTGGPLARWTHRTATWFAAAYPGVSSGPVARALRLDQRRHDLAVLEESVEVLLVRRAGCALLGLVLPPLLALVAAAFGAPVGAGLPATATAGVVLAALLSLAPDVDVRRRAALARQELRRAVCAVLDLAALERAADAGPVEAVERAAAISDTPAFVRIRRALTRAQLDGATPWHGLRDLADATGVVELGDLADILASSGRDGAAVITSLRARATALRAAITAAETTAANTRSEYMVIPVAALGLVFMALLAYPAMARLVLGS